MGTNEGNIPDEGVMGAVNNNNNRLLAKIRPTEIRQDLSIIDFFVFSNPGLGC